MDVSRGASPSADPRRRILEAAAEVFAEQGFAGAGVDVIARRAGVNKAMLYYHVGDKATLYAAVALQYLGYVQAGVTAALAAHDDPRERLHGIQRAFLEVYTSCPSFPPLMLREIAAGGANLPREALEKIAALIGVTRSVVEEGTRRGVFRGASPLLTHLMVVGSAMFIVAVQRLTRRMEQLGITPPAAQAELAATADGIADIIFNGIVERPNPGGGK